MSFASDKIPFKAVVGVIFHTTPRGWRRQAAILDGIQFHEGDCEGLHYQLAALLVQCRGQLCRRGL
jgi:hypothetical protein